MKKTFLLAMLTALLFTACKKQTDGIKPLSLTNDFKTSLTSSSSIRVDTIKKYNLNQSYDPYYYITNLAYAGKLLISSHTYVTQQVSGQSGTSVPIYVGTSIHTYFEYYNNNEQLTGTGIGIIQSGPVDPGQIEGSRVTYKDGHIATIQFLRQHGIPCKKFFLTYSNDQLTEIFEPNTVKINYEYDAKGNNIKEINQRFINGAPSQDAVITEISTFDEKPNFQNSLPLWPYFKCYELANTSKPDVGVDFTVLQKGFTNTPGANNPLKLSTNGSQSAFTYKYLNNGYPFQICDSKYIWHYSYTTLK
jgi:hypothetical protein